MAWYAASLVMVLERARVHQNSFLVMEDICLVQAPDRRAALRKARDLGRNREDRGSGVTIWKGNTGAWKFRAVRQLIDCGASRPESGAEVSFAEWSVATRRNLRKLATGRTVRARCATSCDIYSRLAAPKEI